MNAHSHIPVVIITGCSSGIGRATALLLAQSGWRVFATARRPETLSVIANERITPLRLDVAEEASMIAAVQQVFAQAGRIDALVNNAGYAQLGPLEQVTAGEIHSEFETNTFGPLRLIQLVLPTMRAQGSGRIINVSTMGGRVVLPFNGLYNGSKFALEAMSDALRMETRQFGIYVIVIEPGAVGTSFNQVAAKQAHRFFTDTDSPYHRYSERFRNLFNTSQSSPPETVAKVILQALTATHPNARYAATLDARVMLAIVPRLSDSMRDALWSRMLGLQTPVASRQQANKERTIS